VNQTVQLNQASTYPQTQFGKKSINKTKMRDQCQPKQASKILSSELQFLYSKAFEITIFTELFTGELFKYGFGTVNRVCL